MSLVATPESTNKPPRVRLDLTTPVADGVFTSIVIKRNGTTLRVVPPIGADSSVAYDYEAPYDTQLSYVADGYYIPPASPDWTENWASLVNWTGDTGNFSVSGGKAHSSILNSRIVRTATGSIQRLDVTSPSQVRIELLSSSDTVVGSVQIDSKVTVTGSTGSTVPGGGSFSVLLSNGILSVQAADSSWNTSVAYTGVPTKVRVVALPIVAGAYVSSFGTAGTGTGQFSVAGDMAQDSAGNIYIMDASLDRVQKFSANGTYLLTFGSVGDGINWSPGGVAIASTGSVWVSDWVNNRILKFSPTGDYISKFGIGGAGNGQFDQPLGLAVDSSGNLFVADTGNNRIQKFNSLGVYQSKFGTPGVGSGQFSDPIDIAINSSGSLWVTDSGNNRLQKFSSTGTYSGQFGTAGAATGQFSFPQGLAIDTLDNIYVADTQNNRVQVFTAAGAYVKTIGSSGSGNGQFNQPRGVLIEATTQDVLVSGTSTKQIQRFSGSTVESSVGQIVETPVVSQEPFSFASNLVTLAGEGAWLIHPTIPDLSVQIDYGPDGPCCAPGCSNDNPGVVYLDPTTESVVTYAARSTVHPILGSNLSVVVASGRRAAGIWTLIVQTCDYVGRDALLALLDDQQPILLQLPSSFDFDLSTGWYAIGDVDESRITDSNLTQHSRRLSLPMQPVAQPALTPTIGHTWGDLLTEGLTWQGVLDTYGIWLNVLTGEPA